MKLMNKKGSALAGIASVFTALATIGIIIAISILVIAKTKTEIGVTEGYDANDATACATSLSCNSSNKVLASIDDGLGFLPIIVIAAVGAVLMGLVAMFKMRSN